MAVGRMKLFTIALLWSGKKAQEFAKSIGVSRGFLSDVLRGVKTSARVSKEVESFIDSELRDLGDYLN